MKKLTFIQNAIFLLLLACSPCVIASTFTLKLTPSTITFYDADPDIISQLQANAAVLVSITVNGNPNSTWSLTTQALGDLWSGAASIPISNVSWVGTKNTGDNQVIFYNGSLSSVTSSTVATGVGKDASVTGTLQFYLKNLWTYSTGTYTQNTVNFTLSSP